MATRKRTAPPSTRMSTAIEWTGGIHAAPAYVGDEGEPFRPEALYWIGAEGAILGLTMDRPGELLAQASQNLQDTMERPLYGPPHRPTRVRVASPALAEALRAGHPGLEVVCAPTPELDGILALLRAQFDEADDAVPSYLAPGLAPEAMGAFFEAAADLFRAAPWERVPGDECLFSLTVEPLGVRDAVISVIGQLGQNLGLLMFTGLDDFEVFIEASTAMDRGERPRLPLHLALNYERGAELPPELRREVSEHRWEVAGPHAYPSLFAIDEDIIARPPGREELILGEAVARALSRVMTEEEALRAAWDGGEPFRRTVSVATHAGPLEVTLGTPFRRAGAELDLDGDLLAELAALERDDGEIDAHRREALEEALAERFVASPEAADLDDPLACRLVMDLSVDAFGRTIATLGAAELRAVVFEVLPRDVVGVEAAEARPIVEALRAFYRFARRELGLAQADACLRVLGGSAVKRLETALSDGSRFGMAKSLFAAGAEAGFDLESEDGLEAWMSSLAGKPLPPSLRLPGLPAPPAREKAPRKPTTKKTTTKKARKKAKAKPKKRR